MIHIKHQIVHK